MRRTDAVIVPFTNHNSAERSANKQIAPNLENNSGLVGIGYRPGLRAAGKVRYITENRQIYAEGEDADTFFKVVSGVVRVCTFLGDGRRQIDAFHPSGDVFGLETGAYSLTAEFVCASTLISYRRCDLARFAANNEPLSRQLLFYAMRSLARAQAHSVLLGRRTAVEKVAAFIIDWAGYSPNSNVVALPMTRQDIADYLGLSIETVSRTFSRLEREAFIEVTTARQITLKDRKGLHDLNN